MLLQSVDKSYLNVVQLLSLQGGVQSKQRQGAF